MSDISKEEAIRLLKMIHFEHAECYLNTWYSKIDDDMQSAINLAIDSLKTDVRENIHGE